MSAKPPYRVMTMREVNALEPNGFTVASTFSGGGGSCTGYRMAGFRVAYANEFVDSARETCAANHPTSYLDGRDIRTVTVDEVLDILGMKPGELDLFDGSPPCASFSTAGKREKGWGTVKKYSDTEQRSDDLFFEYIRLLEGLQPKTFVAENVSGLVKGTAKGYFKRILARMQGAGYRVSARLLDAQWLGVPQGRQRIIFVGVRSDLGLDPVHPDPLPYRYSIRDALEFGPGENVVEPESWMTGKATGREWLKIPVGGQSEKYFQLTRPHPDEPVGTVTASGGNAGLASVAHWAECRKFSIAELKRLCGFPDDYRLAGTYAQQWERMGRSVPPVMMMRVAETIRDRILSRL